MPLTADRPKPMVAIAGRPILERILLGMRGAGIEEAVIVHGYMGDAIEQYFGDGHDIGLRLQYREQESLTGTARAMMLAEDLCDDAPFLLHWGDILVDPANYQTIFTSYADCAPEPACVLGINWVEDPWAGGAVYRDGARVTKLLEKPPRGTAGTHWNIGGVIALSPKIWPALHQVQPPSQGEFYVTEAIDLLIQQGETVLPHEIIGERVHITSPEDVEALHTDPRIAAWESEYAMLAQ